jgi:hypothetical protein
VPKSKKPPTFRGSDFAMRYEQGRWSEDRIIEAVCASDSYWAFPYGRSGVGPQNKDKIAEYWAKYIEAESVGKRPDILVIRRFDLERLGNPQTRFGDTTLATDQDLAEYLQVAVCAIEAENSLWNAAKMPDYGKTKLTKLSFVAPTVIVKREDESELLLWQNAFSIPICVVQAFFDRAYIIALDKIVNATKRIRATFDGEGVPSLGFEDLDRKTRKKAAENLQKQLGVFITEQAFADSRTGTSTKKTIYRAHYSITQEFGIVSADHQPQAEPGVIEEPNGKIMAYVRFKGGKLEISSEAIQFFDQLATRLSDS